MDTYNRIAYDDKYKGTAREVGYEQSKAMQRYEREMEENRVAELAFLARQRQRQIRKLKKTMEYVHDNPQPGQYTIVDRPEFADPLGYQANGNGYYLFNKQGSLSKREPLAPFYVHKPLKQAVFTEPSRAQRRQGITEIKPRYNHLLEDFGNIYSKHGSWAVDFDMSRPPPVSEGSLGYKHFESLPRPDNINVRMEPSSDLTVTYTWLKSRIELNKLKHALNGNISFFRCDPCGREFAIKGMSKTARCERCKNSAIFVKAVERKKIEGPKGGRGGGKATMIRASEQRSFAEAAGASDAAKAKDAEKREVTTTTPEGHVVDVPTPGEVTPPPETEYSMPSTLFLHNTNRRFAYNWIVIALIFLCLTVGVALTVVEHYLTAAIPGCMALALIPVVRKTLPYLRFQLEQLLEPEDIPDMRPDYMGHSKMKHQGRKACYSVVQTTYCHTTEGVDAPLAHYRSFFDYITGQTRRSQMIVVDVEVFSQIAPSVRMVPEQHAIDRIDNSISRLATVNVDRRNSTPYLDSTLTLLKAYHWHHVQVKITNGYFSPYELTVPTRR
jgi:DNA-directed RNA polymerase subunit RPC12/RpoP